MNLISLFKHVMLISALTLTLHLPLHAQPTVDNPASKYPRLSSMACDFRGRQYQPVPESVAQLFKKAKVEGTLYVIDPIKAINYIYNVERAKQRFYPASTFKILNTLIAFELEKTNESEVFPYHGEPLDSPNWQENMGIEQAFKRSNLPIFQTLAKRIGTTQYHYWLTQSNYGNREVGEDPTTFWLQGPLAISAGEQAAFLDGLQFDRGWPFAPQVFSRLMAIMPTKVGSRGTMYYKTGWTGWNTGVTPRTAWVVGWVKPTGRTDDTLISFALNIEPTRPEHLEQRMVIINRALQQLKLL